jgi:hypothetical protein
MTVEPSPHLQVRGPPLGGDPVIPWKEEVAELRFVLGGKGKA